MSIKSGVEKFDSLIEELKKAFKAHSDVFIKGSSDGDYPDSLGATGTKQEDLKESFSRQEIDDEYLESLGGTANRKIGLFNQNEVLASAHKSTTLRYRGRIETFMVGSYREHGQLQSNGYLSLALQQSALVGNEQD